MTVDEFNKFVQEFIDSEIKILETKGNDYSAEKDRFSNFRKIGNDLHYVALGQLNERHSMIIVWWVAFTKHILAITSYLKFGKVESESIQERIKDARNYLLLLAAMIKDGEI